MALIARKNSTIQIDTDAYFKTWCNRIKEILCTGTEEVVAGTGNNGRDPIYGHGWTEAEANGITELVFRRLRAQKTRDGRQLSVFGAARSLNLKADWTNRVIDNLLIRGCKIEGYEEAVEAALDDLWFSDTPVTAQNAAIALIQDETLFEPSKSQALPGNNVDGTRLDGAPKTKPAEPLTRVEKTEKELDAEATEILRKADPNREKRAKFFETIEKKINELKNGKVEKVEERKQKILDALSKAVASELIGNDSARNIADALEIVATKMLDEAIIDVI